MQALREKGRFNLDEAYQKHSAQYNKHRTVPNPQLGDKVWRRRSSVTNYRAAKLASKYFGPFVIYGILSPVVVELSDEGG